MMMRSFSGNGFTAVGTSFFCFIVAQKGGEDTLRGDFFCKKTKQLCRARQSRFDYRTSAAAAAAENDDRDEDDNPAAVVAAKQRIKACHKFYPPLLAGYSRKRKKVKWKAKTKGNFFGEVPFKTLKNFSCPMRTTSGTPPTHRCTTVRCKKTT